MTGFTLQHVYEAQQFDRELLEIVFNVANDMKASLTGDNQYARELENCIMASLFYEPSTRTRFSFESAMNRLGGKIITTENAREFSSVAKGETLYDTIRVMNSYADVIVIRHHEAGSAKKAAEASTVPVISAGDGAGQHPTQALLDMYTIKDYFSAIENLDIALVGDLKYGRTVRSLTYLLTKYDNIRLHFVSPAVCRMEHDIKDFLNRMDIPWTEDENLEAVLPQMDCVYMTRVQKERFQDPEDYKKAAGKYVLDLEKARMMKKNAIIMHPLPRVNEIPREVDDDPRARYFEQAQNGLYVRMALLYLLLTN